MSNAILRATEVLTADWGYAWSPRRITVSSVGVKNKLKRFLVVGLRGEHNGLAAVLKEEVPLGHEHTHVDKEMKIIVDTSSPELIGCGKSINAHHRVDTSYQLPQPDYGERVGADDGYSRLFSPCTPAL